MNKFKVIILVIILFGFYDFIIGQKTKFEFINGSVYSDTLYVLYKKTMEKDINLSDSLFGIQTKGFGYFIKEYNSETIDTEAAMTNCMIADDTVFIYNTNSRFVNWDQTIIKLNIKDSSYISYLNMMRTNDLCKLKESNNDFKKEIDLLPIESDLYFYNKSCFMNDSIISGYLYMGLPAYIYKQNKGDNTYWTYDVNNFIIRAKFECILIDNTESMQLDND